jgi:hypothetical protein
MKQGLEGRLRKLEIEHAAAMEQRVAGVVWMPEGYVGPNIVWMEATYGTPGWPGSPQHGDPPVAPTEREVDSTSRD